MFLDAGSNNFGCSNDVLDAGSKNFFSEEEQVLQLENLFFFFCLKHLT